MRRAGARLNGSRRLDGRKAVGNRTRRSKGDEVGTVTDQVVHHAIVALVMMLAEGATPVRSVRQMRALLGSAQTG